MSSIIRRGFASMDKSRLKKITSLGGKTAHKLKRAHRFTKAEARKAGSKGGKMKGINRRNRNHTIETVIFLAEP